MKSLAVLDYAVIGVFFAVMIGVGAYYSRRSKSSDQFFGNDKTVPWWLSGVSFYMNSFSALAFVMYSALAYKFGWVPVTVSWLSVPAVLLGAWFLAVRWRRAAKGSPIDYIAERYTPGMCRTLAILGLPMQLLDNALKLLAIGTVVGVGMGFPLFWSICISGLIIVLYTFLGGLKATLTCDFIQFLVILVVVFALPPLCLGKLAAVDGGSGLVHGFQVFLDRVPDGFFEFTNGQYTWMYMLVFFCCVGSTLSTNWSLVQRYYSTKSEKDARKMAYLVAVLLFVGPPLFFFPAMAARVFLPELDINDSNAMNAVYATVCRHVLPAGMIGMVIAAMFSATMSSLAGNFNAAAAVVTNELYLKVAKNPSARAKMIAARVATVLVGGLVVGLTFVMQYAQGADDLFNLSNKVFGVFLPPIAIPMLCGILVRRFSRRAGICGLVGGIAVGLALFVLGSSPSFAYWREMVWIFPVTSIATVAFLFLGTWLLPDSQESRAGVDAFMDRLAKSKMCVLVVALISLSAASGHCAESFGPLEPSARPSERAYIWPAWKMPDAQQHQVAAKDREKKSPEFRADDFRRPYIDWYDPNPECKTDLCVITVSGGGFYSCCDEARLQPAIDRLVKSGITVADLTYRTPRPKGLPIHQTAWEDLQRAVRVVRSQAAKRGFDPAKIGATGISAGAKAVLLVATSSLTPAYQPVDELDALPCSLLFAIPQAPAYVLTDGQGTPNTRGGDAPDVKLVPELKFDEKTCPMCLFQGGADDYSPFGSTQIYRQLRRMKIPAEIHLFADRWHGFHGDMNKGDEGTGWDHWFHRAEEFIRQLNFDGRLGDEVALLDRFPDDSARAEYVKEEVWPEGKMPDVQTNQCVPYIEWHIPKTLSTKAIQIMYSGGSYKVNGPSGFEVAPARRYLNAKGMTVVTMRYRTPRPLGGLAKHTTAWQDLQRAIRIVRSKAPSRGLDPNRIGIMGSSAGGHLTLMGATSSRHKAYWPVDELDRIPCNVQWAVAIYPAYSLTDGGEKCNAQGGNEDSSRPVSEFSFDLATCPVLFVHGDADAWAAMNSVKCWEQLCRMGVQGEVHTLATRKHCFQRSAAPGTGSYTFLDRIWEFMNHKGFNR